MVTIFTIPKPFIDPHINIIQRNAIESWTLLRPQCDVALIGNDEGVAQVAEEFNLPHLPQVRCNEFGTPLFDSAFRLAHRFNQDNILLYLNADIILPPEFAKIFQYLPSDNFLVVGQRWDLDVKNLIDYSNKSWDVILRDSLRRFGKIHPPAGSDYFIFRYESFKNIPSFAVGRIGWDNWMIYEARRKKFAAIDATEFAAAIHQNHPPDKNRGTEDDLEGRENMELAGGKKFISLEDTNWKLTNNGLVKKKFNLLLFAKYIVYAPELLSIRKIFRIIFYLPAFFLYKIFQRYKLFLGNLS